MKTWLLLSVMMMMPVGKDTAAQSELPLTCAERTDDRETFAPVHAPTEREP